MQNQRFERLKASVKELTADQIVEFEVVVRQAAGARLGETAIARRSRDVSDGCKCPRCGGAAVRDGRDPRGRQRFRCRNQTCGKSFNPLTGTPFARMRKPEKWSQYVDLMVQHQSLDQIVASGIGVSRLTAWRWRHRLLQLPTLAQTAQIGGIVEVDETFFRSSYKGSRGWKLGNPPENRRPRYRGESAVSAGLSGELVPVLTALDRSSGIVEQVLTARTDLAIEAALKGRIARESVICSDGFAAYARLAAKNGSEHRRIGMPKKTWIKNVKGGSPRKPGRLGLGRVNAHHERLKSFVNIQARGVSTRYLPAYLGWLRAIRGPDFKPQQLIDKALARTPP
jgi:transposase-like protein